MQRTIACAAALLAGCAQPHAEPTTPATGPQFDAAGQLLPPADYRGWRYITSGYAMGYGPVAQAAAAAGVRVFDTVYVAPAAHDQFVATGTWPESTMFVLELRTAEGEGSIVTDGQFQSGLEGLEAAVKDSARFTSGWGYFAFPTDAAGPTGPAEPQPQDSACNDCHRQHGAVENTFTQFYPTLFAVAHTRGTIRPDFPGMPPTAAQLAAQVARDGWPASEATLAALATKFPRASALRERSLNRSAYALQRSSDRSAALGLFEHITRRFPASTNAWDSLSEAHEAADQPEGALTATLEGLRVLPTDTTLTPRQREQLSTSLLDRQLRLTPKGT